MATIGNFVALALLTGLGLGGAASGAADEGSTSPTRVASSLNPQTIERLKGNSGVTLQWISWDNRGVAMVRQNDGKVYLAGGQISQDGAGTLWLDGEVVEAGADYFTFDGLIRISGSPDADRVCEQDKKWHFAITQNRKYYRLREFEWCDGLTDYIDIYF